MDGLAQVAGIGGTINLGGRTFTVRGRTIGFNAAFEGEIVKLRGNPTELIVEAARRLRGEADAVVMIGLVASEVAEKFRNWRFANYQDYAEFLGTPRGDAFLIWYAIKQDAPDVTLEQVFFWFMELRWSAGGKAACDDILRTVETAGQGDPSGNPPGRTPEATVPAAVANAPTGN